MNDTNDLDARKTHWNMYTKEKLHIKQNGEATQYKNNEKYAHRFFSSLM